MQTRSLPEGTLTTADLPESFRPEPAKPRCICPTTEAGSIACAVNGCFPTCPACKDHLVPVR